MKVPFEEAVSAHGPRVLRVCRAVLGAGPDAEDAWSETFLSALRAWPELPEDCHVEAWLVRVAHRKAIDVTRARARGAIPVAEPPQGRAVAPDPGEAAQGRELWRAVAALPNRQRLAVAYHYLGGLTHVETAELIGGTPGAVRRASADGVKALRKVLEEADGEATAVARQVGSGPPDRLSDRAAGAGPRMDRERRTP